MVWHGRIIDCVVFVDEPFFFFSFFFLNLVFHFLCEKITKQQKLELCLSSICISLFITLCDCVCRFI